MINLSGDGSNENPVCANICWYRVWAQFGMVWPNMPERNCRAHADETGILNLCWTNVIQRVLALAAGLFSNLLSSCRCYIYMHAQHTHSHTLDQTNKSGRNVRSVDFYIIFIFLASAELVKHRLLAFSRKDIYKPNDVCAVCVHPRTTHTHTPLRTIPGQWS